MRKWQSLYEVLFFPMIVLFVATVLRDFCGLLLSPSFQIYFNISNQWVLIAAEMLRYLGYYLIQFFPFLVMIKFLVRRYEDSVPVAIGTVAYIIFNVATMFFSKSTLPATAYSSELGISLNLSGSILEGTGIKYPLATGMLPVIIIILLVNRIYPRSRHSSTVGIFAFVNKDASAFVVICFWALIAGVGVAFIWPYVMDLLYFIFNLIAEDITNPMNLFIYGIMEKLMTITDTDSIIHNVFWFSELGGSWMNNGINYLGDVSIWTAQTAAGVYNTGFGRFITPFYINALFIIPAIIIATYQTFTDRFERHKFTLFMIIAILLSLICGNILPLEVYMLIMTPLFYGVHVFLSGTLYAVLQAFKISVGYAYSGSYAFATPGSIIDLLIHIRNSYLFPTIKGMLWIGFLFGLLYYFLLCFYYKRVSMDILQTGKKKEFVDKLVISLGGLDNITNLYSTPTKLIVKVDDDSLLNFTAMQKLGASKIIQTSTTYDISYGATSYLIASEINKQIKKEKDDKQKLK